MAMVQVDLSEYDMLREAKKKAEEEVKELKETIKSLENKSRVILTTEYVYPTITKEKLVNDIKTLIEKAKDNDRYLEDIKFSIRTYFNLPKEIDKIIADNIKFENHIFNFDKCKYSSSQYIGFEDVKAKVEEYYKKDIDKAISNYKESEEEYHRLKDSVEEHVREEYTNEIERLKKEQKQIINYNKINLSKLKEEKDTEINKLKSKIADLNKSKEEKITELEATIKEAEAKLKDITGVKKGFFNKIFG